MQNTHNLTTSAEHIINLVWDFINHTRNYSIEEMFTPALATLYARHKGYNVNVINNHHIEFEPVNDKLYCELIKLVPDDKHLHYEMSQFVRDLFSIDRIELNLVYIEVLRKLFDLVSCHSRLDCFYTPSAITKLMAYIVYQEGCDKVFDPFCGTASIVHELSQFGKASLFTGQELNYKTSIYARLNAEALYGHDECIANVDSLIRWDKCSYDAVVSCPPLDLRLTQRELCIARQVTPECPCRSYEEIILNRPFICNSAKISVMLLPIGICFRGNRDYELRKELVEHNLVDSIIALPANILYGTSIPSVVFVCKRGRAQSEPIKFIHAEDYFLGERTKRIFDYNRFIEMIEGNTCDVVKVSINEVRQYNYNLNPSIYYRKDIELKKGQHFVQLNELITPVEGNSMSSVDVNEFISIRNLSKDFIEVLLNNGKVSTLPRVNHNVRYRAIGASKDKYLLASSILGECSYGINTDGKDIVCSNDIKVFKINETLVTPEYLAYVLINHKAISKGNMPLSNFMILPIVIDSLETQRELVNNEIHRYKQKIDIEREADALRLGVKQNVSDLEHMLGTTLLRINNIIARLEKATPTSENYQHWVKSMKDNIEYLNRIIQYNNARIDAESFNIEKGNISDFLNSYVDAWNNYGGEYFELSIQNRLSDEVKMLFDKTLLTVMLDSILNNAIRHGFHKRKSYTEHNSVLIRISAVEYNRNKYVLLSVANNGDPIAEGFTIEDYISRGRYTASTGRSGLGGHHVYQIVKGHNGFLYLDSNNVWNTIVEVLLPIESNTPNKIDSYDKDCI